MTSHKKVGDENHDEEQSILGIMDMDMRQIYVSLLGHFVWAERHQSLDDTEYTHWATNQPENGSGNGSEDCVVKVRKKLQFLYNSS